jgi:hypothetical protein
MVWHKKGELAGVSAVQKQLGLLFIVVGMALHILGNIGARTFYHAKFHDITIFGLCYI